MIAFLWNCQGLRDPLTAKVLKGFIFIIKPSTVLLMETKNKSRKVELVRQRCFRYSEAFHVEVDGLFGSLGIWWASNIGIEIIYATKNFIHTRVSAKDTDFECFFTFIYGPHVLMIE